MNADGSGLTNLTKDAGGDPIYAWSPDGSRIAFTSYDHIEGITNDNFTPGLEATPQPDAGNGEVYVVNADGSGLTNLSNDPGDDSFDSWSPDGSRITFSSNRDGIRAPNPDDGFTPESYVVNADGSGLTNNPGYDGGFGAWSPDGSRVAFIYSNPGANDIYVMNADGSGQTNLTNGPGDAGGLDLAWSPDGSRIAFKSSHDGANDIYVMNADGSGRTNLSNNPGEDVFGAWSPDGSRIAFDSDRDGNQEIYVVNADGSGLSRLTNNPFFDVGPAWSPDGSRIAFISDRGGNREIYVMNADGSRPTNLTNNPGEDYDPAWSPAVY